MFIGYSKKKYSRPPSLKKPKKIIFILCALVFIALLSSVAYIIFFSEYFIIKNIEIIGNENISKDKIANTIQRQNIFFINKELLQNELSSNFSLEFIAIKKNFPDTLIIHIKEKKPIFVWVIKERGYLVDSEGSVISHITEDNLDIFKNTNYNILRHKFIYQNIPIIYDKNNKEISNKILNENQINFIKNFLVEITKKINLEISYYEYALNEFTLEAMTQEGWKIYFNTQNDIDSQLDKVVVILQNRERIGKIIDYIDLRFGDKIYYK